jgi:acetyltransferase-like isoleucine patch superfamily enzyme
VAIERYVRLVADGDSAEINIGDGTYIYPYVLIKAYNGKINIGKNCTVNDYSILYGHGDLIIGDDVHIAAHTVIVPMNHIYQDPKVPISQQGISKIGVTIEDDVWIGVSTVILDGVKIGKGAVIGAGAVVTKSVPAYSVAAGVPARVIKQR